MSAPLAMEPPYGTRLQQYAWWLRESDLEAAWFLTAIETEVTPEEARVRWVERIVGSYLAIAALVEQSAQAAFEEDPTLVQGEKR